MNAFWHTILHFEYLGILPAYHGPLAPSHFSGSVALLLDGNIVEIAVSQHRRSIAGNHLDLLSDRPRVTHRLGGEAPASAPVRPVVRKRARATPGWVSL